MHNSEILITSIEVEQTYLTVEQLASLCAVEADWVLQHISDGLLPAHKLDSGNWCFSSAQLTRAKRILMVERTFDAMPELAALVADMQEELDSLRRRLRRAGQS
ncbi:MerR family transcriptional regulator [Methylomonas sp. LL1]|uniref:MerR family transcriptional regulator n=1 Tax=Methylomonas sp. LL1 TaxID=2785785 RepID=UPI0018C3DAC4|nr:MerR family transcriptional regulator [Methylomonas sp. LL1]QPK62362.1 MerR family transcriptional regulator [Methylomonas sp. LL1]